MREIGGRSVSVTLWRAASARQPRRCGSPLNLSTPHLWPARYDRTLADAFVIHDGITSAICDAVGATLFAGGDTSNVQTDQETYDLFLRGRALLLESSTRLGAAHDLLAQATHRDPQFVPALVALADSCFFQGLFAKPPRPVWQRVRELAEVVDRLSARGSPFRIMTSTGPRFACAKRWPATRVTCLRTASSPSCSLRTAVLRRRT